MKEHPTEPGLYHKVASDTNQRFVLSIPEPYRDGQPTPLVLVLHYAWPGRLPEYYGEELLTNLVRPALRGLDATMAAPDCLHRDWSNMESEAEVNHLIDLLSAAYEIDQGKIIVTGYSLGGRGAWYMAARNQGRYAAAIPMAAMVPREALEAEWRAPLYVVHSRADEVVAIEPTERAVRQLQERGTEIEFVVLDDVTHFETGRFFRPLRDAVSWLREVWGS